ncbi:MAG: hypothetical protein E5Y05_00225 [Mesorhizobium sp.]|nr:MAG: hypothetical protein E5Y05_00225 [Mesorhizobium sp.]
MIRQHELNDTAEIEIEYNGKYANAKDYRAGLVRADNDNDRPADNDNELSPGIREMMSYDDDIPF